eukprot:TRINITY_DN35374_c0_g1_i1.p1 TRINITY_DN35374_c0_g1~~TRINITY_DN35374_c0_g1_i1.p1  ORF type:complete len:458 (+),score=38.50 TRINITY_DN35374_c0_g1_i1:2-1375(+)
MLDTVYAAIVPAWACLALEFWKRKEAWHSSQWGQTQVADAVQSRTDFWGLHTRSPITGEDTIFFPYFYSMGLVGTFPRKVVSYTMLLCLACVELAVLTVARYYLQKHLGLSLLGMVVSVVMMVFGILGRRVALCLNQWENHRTRSDFVGELARKVFIFEFISRYCLFLYIAFVKAYVEGCVVHKGWLEQLQKDPCSWQESSSCDMCTHELELQMPTVFGCIIMMNFVEVVWPLAMKLRRFRQLPARSEDPLEKVRDDVFLASQLETYGSYDVDGSFDDYFEILIIFGYTALFGMAFPVAPAVTAVALLIELRVDGIKLCNVVQRPFPQNAKDNQTWFQLFYVVSCLSVVSNAALATFTYELLGGSTTANRLMRFLLFLVALCFVCCISRIAIPDHSSGLESAKARDHFFLDELSGHFDSILTGPVVTDSKPRRSSVNSSCEDKVEDVRNRLMSKSAL